MSNSLTLTLDHSLIAEALGDWLATRHPTLKDHDRSLPVLSNYPPQITIVLTVPDLPVDTASP